MTFEYTQSRTDADEWAALMDCYNPTPLPVETPSRDCWMEDCEDGSAAQRLPDCYNV
jgi:hypothetical protein